LTCVWSDSEAPWPVDASAAAHAYAGGDELAWLDTSAAAVGRQCSSLIASRPLATLTHSDGGPAELHIGGRLVDRDGKGWRLWRRAIERLGMWPASPAGLCSGWVGYVGFGMARQLERLPASHREPLGLPLMRLALFDRAIVLDHAARRATAIEALDLRERLGLSRDDDGDWIERWRSAARARSASVALAPPRAVCEVDRDDYELMVRRALEYIAAGDIYQVNLSQRLRLEGVADAATAYSALRRDNPAPYAALLRWDDAAVASVSPELFLSVRGSEVQSRPIKGTRPRTGDALLDRAYREQLLASEKDAAELAMIIDLHRNDLGRACEPGSIHVRDARCVEEHPSVVHTVADIRGRLADGRGPLDLLEACFPAGSISGVPKIRALQIIDELEPVSRGVYTGAIGVLSLDGSMTMNVAIRTLQMRGSTALLHVGGGIVAESDPADEYDETLAKAGGILRALRAVGSTALPAVSLSPRRTPGSDRSGRACR
jgi:para-aminobenzoate synthetase component 1